MLKRNLFGKIEKYPEDYDANNYKEYREKWYIDDCENNREITDEDLKPNIFCECGSDNFKVCWWDYPFTGGFCKIECSNCEQQLILIDDFA